MTNKQAYAGLLERLGDIQDIIVAAEMRFATTEAHHAYYADRHAAIAEAAEAISSLLKRVGELEGLYHELLFAVSVKHSSETRHETALRYIKQAEQGGDKARAALNSDAPLSIGEGDRG